MKTELITTLENNLPVTQQDFDSVSTDSKVTYAQEAGFALQLLGANDFLGKMARNNPQSLRDAIINVSAIGTTLNPAEKKAYLVPRKGVVCLDLSYRGLADLAVASGACEWIDAKLVYDNDKYEAGGMGELPKHTPANPFKGQRGELIGVYAAAKRKDGSYAIREMDMQQINAIKARSESAKRGGGPWKTDFNEMVLKTPVKAVVKMLQGTNTRIDNAVNMLNSQGEGIDFNSESKIHPRDVNASQKAQAMVNDLLSQNDMQWEQYGPMANAIGSEAASVDELTELECGKLIGLLEIRLRKMQERAAR